MLGPGGVAEPGHHVLAHDRVRRHITPLAGRLPQLDRLVVGAGEELAAGRRVRDAAHHAGVRLPRRHALPLGQVPHAQLAVSGGGGEGGEAGGVLGQAGQAVPVAVQAAEERLGEHSLQLDGVKGALVLALSLERVLGRAGGEGEGEEGEGVEGEVEGVEGGKEN